MSFVGKGPAARLHARFLKFKLAVALILLLFPVIIGQHVDASPVQTDHFAVQVDPNAGPAWFAVDLTDGITLYDDGGDVPLRPASTAKLVTAITVLRVLSVNEQVTIVDADMVPEDYSRMGLQPGDVATVEQLLYGALIPSGGDAAMALARAGGSALDPETPDPVERFVQEMNTVAASIGMTSSSFGNPVGADDERTWTTARDLVRAGRYVLGDPLLSAIVRTPRADVSINGPAARDITIENSNQFVLFDEAIGIKTGTTDEAGENLITAFRFGDHIVVTVILGSADRYADTTAMLDLIREQWTWLQLGRDASSLGARDELGASGLWMPVGRTILLKADQLPRVSYSLDLDSGASRLTEGAATFMLDGQALAVLPVYRTGAPGDG